MPEIRALFWDVGGVLLTNAWDHEERDLAIEHFHLDRPSFESRHCELFTPFEEGKFTLDDYLNRAVFDQPRKFSREDFKQFMFSLSKPKPGALELAGSLSKKYRMATINNESRELNDYRINNFGLDRLFNLFVTSCFVGVRKPNERIYRLALDLTHQPAENCCFIDDRPVNIAAAAQLGFATVLVKASAQLQRNLDSIGVRS